jgi:hypothetical protein
MLPYGEPMAGPQGPGQTPAGWYADPSGDGGQRYWDGTGWTEHLSGGRPGPGAGGAPAPTVDQIRYSSYLGNAFLATFDGVILEIFGPTGEMGASSETMRFHRNLMTITIEAPNRKGLLTIEIYAGASPSRSVPSCQVRIREQDRAVIEFFERVRAALPAA